jgi:CheY-like chemotaxis protein
MRHEPPLIVLVDDDPAGVELLTEWFAGSGYQAIGCLSSSEAPTVIRREQPDLVVLHLHMGRPDASVTLLELLRRVPATQAIPVIVCTADHWMLTRSAEQLHALACAVVPKPFDLDGLLTTVRAWLASSAAIAVGV